MKTPNLFDYATSELSQDAFFCWLLSWADPQYYERGSKLSKVAINLMQTIFHRANTVFPETITSIEVRRQVDHIDVLCVVNGKIAILIEDKVGTVEHGNQIARYVQLLQTKYNFDPQHIIPVYIQTGDQDFSAIKAKGYLVLRRTDLLDIFGSEDGLAAQAENDIFNDFSRSLRVKEDAVSAYDKTPIQNWDWNCWVGFYQALQDKGIDGKWHYVANPAGGFLCFRWHTIQGNNGEEVYLQWDQSNICFKVVVFDKSNWSALRNHWCAKILEQAPKYGFNTLRRPARLGSGTYMTVAILPESRATDSVGVLDMPKTLATMEQAASMIDHLTKPENPN